MVGWMIMGWLPAYYKEHFSLTQTMAGVYATGYIYPLSMIGVIVGGALADALLPRNRNARILVPAVAMCVAAPAVFIASGTNILWIAIGGFMIYAFTRVFSDANLMSILCMFADGRYIATGYGVLNLFACIIGGLGIYGSGVLRDEHINMSLIFKIAAMVLVVCALLLFVVKRNIEQRNKRLESVNTYDTNEAEPCAR